MQDISTIVQNNDSDDLLNYAELLFRSEEEIKNERLTIICEIILKLCRKIPKIHELLNEEVKELERISFIEKEIKHNMALLNLQQKNNE